ncbi:MAG: DUF5016 domain-containing protein [Paludibacter sp.]
MKNTIKFILLICFSCGFWACTNEDVVVSYPASTPKIDTAIVTETQITYGDSIHVKIAVSDNVAPLSTLILRVVVNNDVVISETIRTKGNSSSLKRAYWVPFVANRPDNAAVKVYLTETNVSGTEKDSIVSTTIAKRPLNHNTDGTPILVTDYYVVPDFGQGTSAKLTKVSPDSLVYKATGLSYKNSFSYKIATKLDKFKRIDSTGMIFGKVGDGIGLINIRGESIKVTDGTLVGISIFTFNALSFTSKVGGKLLEPVKTLDVIADLAAKPETLINNTDFRGGNVYFGENVEVTFTGITGSLANNISPDYFQVTGTNTAKFLGKTGLYKAYYLTTANYLYIEPQPEAVYPETLWIDGTGFGRPSTPYMTTASWNWNSPLDYIPCRLVSTGIYQVTIYCKNTPSTDTNIYGGLDFKYFFKRGWWDKDHEEWATGYKVDLPFLGPADGNGNVKVLSATVVDGVYRITLNQNDKTIKAVKLP